MRILYVEDNPANLFLVKRVAKIGGHEVINYIDGEDALANFSADNPDLVLMDIQLAGELSGLDVVQKLRLDGYQTPIIAVTAYAMVGDRERFLAAGCDDYLAKPLPIPRLVEIIQHYNLSTESGEITMSGINLPIQNDDEAPDGITLPIRDDDDNNDPSPDGITLPIRDDDDDDYETGGGGNTSPDGITLPIRDGDDDDDPKS